MNYEDGFLQAILEAPGDDVPRLVYADWLEERGDPRAELIRIQCAVARMSQDDIGLAALQAQQRRLLDKHAREWCAPPGLDPGRCEFRRGFVEAIEVRADDLLGRAEALFRAAPIRQIHFLHATEHIRELAHCPWLGKVTTLDIGGNSGMRDPEVTALAGSPHLSGLTSLDLSSCSMEQEGVDRLASAEGLRGLRHLRLAGAGIRLSGLQAILQSPTLQRVTALDVRGNHQCWATPNFGEPWVTRTEVNVGNDGVLFLAGCPEAARLERLDLSLNETEESGWEALVTSPHLSGLVSLNVFESGHVFDEEGPPFEPDESTPYTINEEISDVLCIAIPGGTRRPITRIPGDPRFTAPPCTIDEGVVRRLRERFGPRVTFHPPAVRYGALFTGTRADWFGYSAPLDPPEG